MATGFTVGTTDPNKDKTGIVGTAKAAQSTPGTVTDNTPDYTPPEPEQPDTYTPYNLNVDQPRSTTAGQMNTLLQSGNPYIETARKQAQQFANRRGLMNSSLAGGAGVQSAIQSALPIAQQDANTYFTAQKTNVETKNRFLENEQTGELNRAASEQTQRHALERGATEFEQKKELTDIEFGNLLTQMEVDQGYKVDLSNLDQRNKLVQMAKEQGYTIELKDLEQRYLLEQMDVTQRNDLEKLATEHGYTLDLTDLKQTYDLERLAAEAGIAIDFETLKHNQLIEKIGIDQTNTLEQMAAEQGYKLDLTNVEQMNELERMAAQAGIDIDFQKLKFAQERVLKADDQRNLLEQFEKEHGYKLDLSRVDHLQELEKMATEQGYRIDMQRIQQQDLLARLETEQGYSVDLANLQQTNRLQEMAIEHGYNIDIAQMQQQDLLDRLEAEQGYALDLNDAQTQSRLIEMAAQSGYDINMEQVKVLGDLERLKADAGYKSALSKQEADQALSLEDRQSLNRMSELELEYTLKGTQDANSAALQIQINDAQARTNASLEMKTQFNQMAGTILTQAQSDIAEVTLNLNGNMTPDQQAAAIREILDQRDANITSLIVLMDSSVDWQWSDLEGIGRPVIEEPAA